MKKSIIKFAQEQLNAGGFDAGPVDGIYGDRTLRAVENAMENWGNQAPDGWQNWSMNRKLTAYIQMLCKEQKIEVGKYYWKASRIGKTWRFNEYGR
ncbi:MAG: peptidoglycan-binding protein [Deltaproteobacteria bacterium]|nr:peptidoglycan-binding protein [Deltaproteobacteria bacterium]